MKAIVTESLNKRYGTGVHAVKDLTLEIEKGAVYGFLGPNGSGKTTTVRLLNGTLVPSSGSSTVLGLASSDDAVRSRTSTLAELARMYDNLTVYDNLLFFARLYGLSNSQADAKIRDTLTKLEIWDEHDRMLGSFSTGMQKRVYIARTLLNDPEVIFLDEPTSGLDPDSALQVTELIRSLATDGGATIFLCTHNLPLAERICDSYGFLHEGRLVAGGTKETLSASLKDSKKLLVVTANGSSEHTLRSEDEINGIIRRVMEEVGKILEVRLERPTLEALYFHYIKRSGDELAKS